MAAATTEGRHETARIDRGERQQPSLGRLARGGSGAHDFAVVVDTAGRLVSATGRWAALFDAWWRWTPGMSWQHVVPRPGADAAWSAWRRLVQRGMNEVEPFEAKVTWVGPRGVSVQLALRVRPLCDAARRTIGGVAEGRILSEAQAGGTAPAEAADEVAPAAGVAEIRLRAVRGPDGWRFPVEHVSVAARRMWPRESPLESGREVADVPLAGAKVELGAVLRRVHETGDPEVAWLTFDGVAAPMAEGTVLEACVARRGAEQLQMILRDDTVLRTNQRVLSTYCQRLEALLEHGSDGVLTLDHEGVITGVQHGRAGGLALEAGRPLWEVVMPEQRESVQGAIAQAWIAGEPVDFEWRAFATKERWFQVRIAALPLARPEMTFVAVLTETTAQHRAREAQLRLARLVEHSTDGIVGISPEGLITDWSRGAEQATGRSAADVLGRPVADSVPAENRRLEAEAVARALAGERVAAIESRRLTADGRAIAVLVATFPHRRDDGGIAGATQVFRDVSGVRSLEEQLRRAQRLAAQGMLAATTGHEIKNYLGIALGLVQLHREAQPQFAAELDPVVRAIQLAGHISQHLHQLGRRESQLVCRVDLAELAAESCAMLKPVVLRQLTFHNDARGPIVVKMAPADIDQILVNLVLNARDATAGDTGAITVRVGIDGGAAGNDAGERYLSVHDNGAGLTPEVQRRMLESYFTTKAKGRGTGLGLATVQKRVKEAGGRLEFRSAPGEGTTVKVMLPAPANTDVV